MADIRLVKIVDIAATNASSYSTKDNWGYVNYLDTGNITQNVIDSIQYIDLAQEKLPSRAKRKVKKNSIIYSTVRPNQLHYGIIKNQPQNFLVSTGFTVIDVDESKAVADYVYYFLTQKEIVESLQTIGEQSVSTYPSIKPSDIEDIEIPLPSLDVQKKIVGILKSLDAKIESNSAINNNLEQQAKAIYRQMFAASSSSEWTQGTLSDIAEITMGQSPSGSSYNEDGVGTVFYQGRAEFGCRFPTQRLCTTEPKRMARENDVLLSVRAPVGDLNVAREYCCIGRGLASIRSKHNRQSFVLYTVFALQPEMDKFNGEGTVFGSINRDSLNKMAIIIPTDDEMDRFESLVSPMDAQIRANHEEILRLEAIRAALLPKLMTGELDVSNIEY